MHHNWTNCGYRKFHILAADVVATGKTAELPSLKNLMRGWRTNARRKAAQEVHPGGFTEPDGELYRPRSFQAARRS